MKKKLFSWLAMFCFIIPCMFGLSACGKEPAAMTGYKIIVNQQLIAESRTINVTYGDEIEWSAIALYDDSTTSSLPVTDITVTDEDEVVGTKPTVGSYEVKFKYLEYGEYTVTVNVTPKSLEIPTARNLVYNGEAQTTELTGYDEETMTLSGDLTATNASTYAVEVALKDTTNYCWSDGTTASQTVEYLVAKAKIAKPTKVETTYTYTGSPITLQLEGYLEGSMSITGNVETNAGTYTAVVTLEDTANYEWKNAASSEIEWEIEKAQGTAPTSAPAALSGTYAPDKTLADYTVASGYEWADATIVPTVAVSEYAVIYNPDSQNYTDYEMTYTLNIARAQIAVPTVTGSALSFDETEKTVELANFDAAKMSVEGNTETEVGSHTAVVTITDGNYEFVGGETTANIEWEIGKGTPTITIPYDYSKPYDGLRINLPRYEMPALLETEAMAITDGLSISYANSSSEPVAFNTLKEVGTYTMKVATVETAHYYAASAEQTFQIYHSLTYECAAKTVKVERANGNSIYYDGTEKEPEYVVKKNIGTLKDPDWQPLVLGTDYTVEYFNNVDCYDNSYAIVKGKGIYAGEVKCNFTIVPNLENLLSTYTIAGKTAVDGEVTLDYSESGYEVVLNVADTYEDVYYKDNSAFAWTAQTLRKTYLGYEEAISNDTLKFTLPKDARSVSVTYNGDEVFEVYIWHTDEVHNRDYFWFTSDAQISANTSNIWEIDKDATGLLDEVVRAEITSDNYNVKYGVKTGFTVVEDTLNISGTTVSFQIQETANTSNKITLTYEVLDPRKSYIEIIDVSFRSGEIEITEFDQDRKVTIEEAPTYCYFDVRFNGEGHLYKAELLDPKGTVVKTEDGGDVDHLYYDDFEDIGAGTYTLRLYIAEATYVDYYVVIGAMAEGYGAYITLTYNGQEYLFVETLDGGINVKLDPSGTGLPEYFFIYAGEIEDDITTVTVAVEAPTANLYDQDMTLLNDWSNVVLKVLTDAEGMKYAVAYIEIEGESVPFYLYFVEGTTADLVFEFDNYEMEFNYEPVKVGEDDDAVWYYGDFVSFEDPAKAPVLGNTQTINLIAMLDPADFDFRYIEVAPGEYIYDTTVDVELNLFNMMLLMMYGDLENAPNTVAQMMPTLPDINLPVVVDAENGPMIQLIISDMSAFMGGAEPLEEPTDDPADEPIEMPVMVLYNITIYIMI